ncbi:MAG: hypothetical protein JRF61_16005 [Deltaproteobacteria bacterium]|jgi:hypothetical protein|nr:hypothetical protein [Deltaproteobacteria bacterium]
MNCSSSRHINELYSPRIDPISALSLRFLMLIFAGRVSRHQQEVTDYLQEEEA